MLFYHLEAWLAVVEGTDLDDVGLIGSAIDVNKALGDSEDATVDMAS